MELKNKTYGNSRGQTLDSENRIAGRGLQDDQYFIPCNWQCPCHMHREHKPTVK
jgi:hypothetical protein